jgi:hypothetical protein
MALPSRVMRNMESMSFLTNRIALNDWLILVRRAGESAAGFSMKARTSSLFAVTNAMSSMYLT